MPNVRCSFLGLIRALGWVVVTVPLTMKIASGSARTICRAAQTSTTPEFAVRPVAHEAGRSTVRRAPLKASERIGRAASVDLVDSAFCSPPDRMDFSMVRLRAGRLSGHLRFRGRAIHLPPMRAMHAPLTLDVSVLNRIDSATPWRDRC